MLRHDKLTLHHELHMMGVCSEMLLGVLMLVFFIHSSFQVARAAAIFLATW